MFLTSPKPRNRALPLVPAGASAAAPPPPPEHEVASRVKKACNRCRIKKLKCDGKHPCGRCEHEKVICKQDRVSPRGAGKTDVKALSRNYIASLEAEQAYLMDALRQLCEVNPNNEKVKAIVERLQASGFDVSPISSPSLKTASTAKEPALSLPTSGLNAWTPRGLPSPRIENSNNSLDFGSFRSFTNEPMPSFDQQFDQGTAVPAQPSLVDYSLLDQPDASILFSDNPASLLPNSEAWAPEMQVDFNTDSLANGGGEQVLDQWWNNWTRVNNQLEV